MRFSTTRILPAILFVWLTSLFTAIAQYQPYAVQWLQKAYNPCAGRRYLGVTNLYAGSNVLFTAVGDCDYRINVSVPSPIPPMAAFWLSDGTNIFWTNTPPSEAWIGDGITKKIQLRTDGTANFTSNLTCKAQIITKDFSASGNIVGTASAVFYGNGAGLTNLPCCTNGAFVGTFSGTFYGNGDNITNLTGNAIYFNYDPTLNVGSAAQEGVVYVNDATGNPAITLSGLDGSLTGTNFVALPGGGFFGDGSGLTNVPCCTNGAYSGSFTGDGSGLTNLNVQTNWPYTAITNPPWLTNITLADLPPGVLTNNESIAVTFSNAFTVSGPVTNRGKVKFYEGASTFANPIITGSNDTSGLHILTGGTYYFVNGGLAMGGWGPQGVFISDVAGRALCFGGASGTGPFLQSAGNTTTLQIGVSAAAPAAQTFISCGARSGTDTDKPGGDLTVAAGKSTGTGIAGTLYFATGGSSNATGKANSPLTNWVALSPSGTLSCSNSVTVANTITATNGIYYIAQSNSVVATNVIQPLHTWASMMGFVTNTIGAGSANTYFIVTNYSTARTNQMTCSLTAGTITNTIAGFYYCAIHMSMKSVDAGALVEGDLLLNGVERDEISFQTQFDPGTPRYKGASAFGILYIPANTQITFQVKSSGAGGIEIRRQQLVVMPP